MNTLKHPKGRVVHDKKKGDRHEKAINLRGPLERAIDSVRALDLPPLGPDFRYLEGSNQADALVAHRFLKLMVPPTSISPSTRRRDSIFRMLKFDEAGPSGSAFSGQCTSALRFDYRLLPAADRRVYLQAKSWLARILRGFRFNPRDFSFPSGEGVNSSGGYTDFYHKLANSENWVVGPDCVELAASVAYHNMSLKRVVRARFKALFPGAILDHWRTEAPEGPGRGWYMWVRMFRSVVEISGVSRLSTVTKTAKTDRVITMEATWNMVVQLTIANGLRKCLERELGYHLHTRQDLHGGLIRHATNATVDFANASNSNWLCVFKDLFPKEVQRFVLKARSAVTEFEGEYQHLNMLAPMGCGFTFEIMSLTLLAYSRQFSAGASVFGDDVIIEASQAPAFIAFCENVGWTINTSKSFVEGNFRESCGKYYDLLGKRYLLSYDFPWPETMRDVFVLCNKIYRLLEVRQISVALGVILAELHRQMLNVVPRLAVWGTADAPEVLPDYCVLGEPQETYWRDPRMLHAGSMYQRRLRVNLKLVEIDQGLACESEDLDVINLARAYRMGLKPIRFRVEPRFRLIAVDPVSGTLPQGVPLFSFIPYTQ